MDLRTLKEIPPWEWPENARDTILQVLGERDALPADRLFAVECAGDSTIVDDNLVDKLLEILQCPEESEELRGRAAISLGPVLEMADMEGVDDFDEASITEETFHRIQDTLHGTYSDIGLPIEVRRRSLEASVRSPESWHEQAVRAAFSSNDENWKLTAVFCMQYVRGFDAEIVESLASRNPGIHYQAVCAAGTWEVSAAWPHIVGILASAEVDKPLLIAAIEAVANIRPKEAEEVLGNLLESDDTDIAEAVHDALAMAGDPWMDDDEEEEDSEDDPDDDDED